MSMTDEEEVTSRLLRLAGARPDAPTDRTSRVRSAVHQQWLLHTRQRRFHRRIIKGMVLVGVAASALLIIKSGATRNEPTAVGSIDQVIDVTGMSGLSPGSLVYPAKWMETGAARVALRLSDGSSVRLDTAARIRFLSSSIIELASGGLYLDTGSNSPGFEVRTPVGTAHDIGTQFEVRVTDGEMRVRVRTGLVEVRGGGRAASVRPGTEVTCTRNNLLTKPIAAFGSDWDWTGRLAPRFDADGKPLAAFLEYTAREQGWTLRYGDPQLARDASGIVLHGSLLGLEAADAVAVAVRMSGLSYTLEYGNLVITRPAAQK